MALQFVGDNAKWNVHCITGNQEPEESVISYETPRDYKSINSKLFSSNKDCTDWLCQMQAGPAMVWGKKSESKECIIVGLWNTIGFDEKSILCNRTICNKKTITICSVMWMIKKEGKNTTGTGLEKRYQEKEGADEWGQECYPFMSKGYLSFSSSQDRTWTAL